MTKERLDVLLVERGLCESREQAQRLILAGKVRVDGQAMAKAGHAFAADSVIEVIAPEPFVSRGGVKLEHAFKTFRLDAAGRVCLDVGASTGGFTDCLLQHGAAKVYALDVGKGLLHWKLRNDPRVIVIDGFNARYLDPASLPEKASFATIDVSFISLTLILPAVARVLLDGAHVVSLIKPQFEAGREQVGKGGVVRSAAVRSAVVERIRSFGTAQAGLLWMGVCESPIRGPAGNVEFLACWRLPDGQKGILP